MRNRSSTCPSSRATLSIPLAAVGAGLALKLTNSPVSVVVFIGLIMLVAVAAEHPAAAYGTIEVRELWPPL